MESLTAKEEKSGREAFFFFKLGGGEEVLGVQLL